jgi:hypothetical protein
VNRIEHPDKNPQSYAHLVFDKGTKNLPWRKDILFNKCCQENLLSACRKLKVDPCLLPHTSVNSKWIKDLKHHTQNLEVSIGKSMEYTGSNTYRQGLPQ